MERKIVSASELMPQYEELLRSGARLPLTVSGGSMTPFLVSGRDTVLLAAAPKEIKKGDILLFRRSDGGYVLHRLLRTDGKTLAFVGDAQDEIEEPVLPEQVIAKVVAVRRKGKELDEGSAVWRFYRRIWPLTVGHRKTLLRCAVRIKARFGRIK